MPLETLGESNIKGMTLEGPPPKKDFIFNPEKDISEAEWIEIKESLRKKIEDGDDLETDNTMEMFERSVLLASHRKIQKSDELWKWLQEIKRREKRFFEKTLEQDPVPDTLISILNIERICAPSSFAKNEIPVGLAKSVSDSLLRMNLSSYYLNRLFKFSSALPGVTAPFLNDKLWEHIMNTAPTKEWEDHIEYYAFARVLFPEKYALLPPIKKEAVRYMKERLQLFRQAKNWDAFLAVAVPLCLISATKVGFEKEGFVMDFTPVEKKHTAPGTEHPPEKLNF